MAAKEICPGQFSCWWCMLCNIKFLTENRERETIWVSFWWCLLHNIKFLTERSSVICLYYSLLLYERRGAAWMETDEINICLCLKNEENMPHLFDWWDRFERGGVSFILFVALMRWGDIMLYYELVFIFLFTHISTEHLNWYFIQHLYHSALLKRLTFNQLQILLTYNCQRWNSE